MRVLFVIILLAAFVHPTLTLADVQTFTATHTYILGDDDSRNSARQKCLAEAKRKILEQVGVYLESKSELITSSQSTTSGSAKSPQTTNEERQQITEQIDTLAAGVMRTEVIKEEFGEVNGRLQITLTLKSEVDPDDIQKQLAARRVDQDVQKRVMQQEQRLVQFEDQLRMLRDEMRTVPGNASPGAQKRYAGSLDVVAVSENANKGDASAQTDLGLMYAIGRGVPQDFTKAAVWYRKAAAQNYAVAQASLGFMYYQGEGVPQDYRQAFEWTSQAAQQNLAGAEYNLGLMYAEGKGVPHDHGKAVAWFRKAAEQNVAEAQISLGQSYANGKGIAKDDTEAVRWFRKAAEQGSARGQLLLGWCYTKGRGIPKDDTEAVEWYRKAADQENAEAQNNLGNMYLGGKGVSQNDSQAAAWYRKAAQRGNANGQTNLGWLYRDGRGVSKDPVKASMWLVLAVLNGDSRAAKLRDDVAGQLTPSERSKAQSMVQACQASRYKDCD